MTTRRVLATLVASVLFGCDSKSPPPVEAPSPQTEHTGALEFPLYQTQAECENGGGEWKAWCTPNTPTCVMPYPDGGKKCSDPSECDSRVCMVDDEEECTPGAECKPLAQPKTGEPAVGICKRRTAQCEQVITVKGGRAQNPYGVPASRGPHPN